MATCARPGAHNSVVVLLAASTRRSVSTNSRGGPPPFGAGTQRLTIPASLGRLARRELRRVGERLPYLDPAGREPKVAHRGAAQVRGVGKPGGVRRLRQRLSLH